MSEETSNEDTQDPMLPPNWFAWETGKESWHARPPGRPEPNTYVHGTSKQQVADKAWLAHRRADAAKERKLAQRQSGNG